MKTRPEERTHSLELCQLVFDSEAEFPHDEAMRLMVSPIFMDDDPGAVMRFAAWHTPHYVWRLVEDANRANELEKQVHQLKLEVERSRATAEDGENP